MFLSAQTHVSLHPLITVNLDPSHQQTQTELTLANMQQNLFDVRL